MNGLGSFKVGKRQTNSIKTSLKDLAFIEMLEDCLVWVGTEKVKTDLIILKQLFFQIYLIKVM